MARAKEIKLGTATVYLHNFTKERAERLTELLQKFHAGENSALEEPVAEAFVEPQLLSTLSEKAIGVTFDKATNKQVTVTVLYNLETKEAKVDHVQAADGLRDATNKFKMLASDLRFV